MWDIGNADVGDKLYWGCGMLQMWDFRNVGCGMLVYKMYFLTPTD